MSQVRTADLPSGGREALVGILVRAFIDDPAWVSIGHPSRRRRERIMHWTFAGEVRRGQRWATHSCVALSGEDALRGLAVAYPSSVWRRPHWSSVFELAALLGGPRAVARGLQFTATAERFHPSAPHVYLALLAVDPPHQGRGVGSAMLREVIEASAGLPVYLETAQADNVPFYQSFGFAVTGEAELPRGGRLWALRRPAH